MKNIIHNEKIAKILVLFIFCVVIILPVQTVRAYDYPTAESSTAEIAQAIQDAIDSGWSAEQIAGAAAELGIDLSQVQAAVSYENPETGTSIDETYNYDTNDVVTAYENRVEPLVEIPELTPPPPPTDAVTLNSVYNGVSYTTDIRTGLTTVNGNVVGYFDKVSGLYTDPQGNHVDISTLTGLSVSNTNAAGTVTGVADGLHSYQYDAAMWSAGRSWLNAKATGDTDAMRAAVDAANAAVRAEAGSAPPTPITVPGGPPTVSYTPAADGSIGTVNSIVVNGITYDVGSGGVVSLNGTPVGTYNPPIPGGAGGTIGTVRVTNSVIVYGRENVQSESGSTFGIYDLSNGMFTPTQQTGISYVALNDYGSYDYACANSIGIPGQGFRVSPPRSASGGIPIPTSSNPSNPNDTSNPGDISNPSNPNDSSTRGRLNRGTVTDTNAANSNVNANTARFNNSSANGVVASLLANPPIINLGQSSTLSWNSNADSCNGIGFTAGGPSGSRSTGALNDLGTHNYLIFCSVGAFNSPPALASVEVLNPNASIALIYANPQRVRSGGNSTITWSLSNVRNCSITKNKVLWRPNLSSSGSSVEIINNRTIYTMSGCTESGDAVLPPRSATVNILTSDTPEAYTED